jgi:hypothetical protein
MKSKQVHRLGALNLWKASSLERLQPPEIVGEVANQLLEGMRRLWWRAFDRLCGCFISLRLSIFDRIHRPDPPTPADLQREANHEWLASLSGGG